MNDNDHRLTLTVEEAAKLLGIGRSTAYELVHTGDIPSLRLGRRIVVPRGKLAERLGVDGMRAEIAFDVKTSVEPGIDRAHPAPPPPATPASATAPTL